MLCFLANVPLVPCMVWGSLNVPPSRSFFFFLCLGQGQRQTVLTAPYYVYFCVSSIPPICFLFLSCEALVSVMTTFHLCFHVFRLGFFFFLFTLYSFYMSEEPTCDQAGLRTG